MSIPLPRSLDQCCTDAIFKSFVVFVRIGDCGQSEIIFLWVEVWKSFSMVFL